MSGLRIRIRWDKKIVGVCSSTFVWQSRQVPTFLRSTEMCIRDRDYQTLLSLLLTLLCAVIAAPVFASDAQTLSLIHILLTDPVVQLNSLYKGFSVQRDVENAYLAQTIADGEQMCIRDSFYIVIAQHEIAENIGIALFFYQSDRYLIPKTAHILIDEKKRNAGHHTGNYNNAIK